MPTSFKLEQVYCNNLPEVNEIFLLTRYPKSVFKIVYINVSRSYPVFIPAFDECIFFVPNFQISALQMNDTLPKGDLGLSK